MLPIFSNLQIINLSGMIVEMNIKKVVKLIIAIIIITMAASYKKKVLYL